MRIPRGLPVEARDLARLDRGAIERVADQVRPQPRDADELHDLLMTMFALRPQPAWRPWFEDLAAAGRAAEIPAANGHGNARSIAQVHAILANGGAAQGKRFLSEAGCRAALVPQVEGMDLVLGFPARYGLGFGLPDMIPMKNPNSMFWGGYGGSLIIIDMDAKTTFAYAMNKMGTTTIGDERAMSIVRAMWSAL